MKLGVVLMFAAACRVAVSGAEWLEVYAIGLSMLCIVVTSVVLGTVIPTGLKLIGTDPAHAAPLIQVLMDVTGVIMVCTVSSALFATISSTALREHIIRELTHVSGQEAAKAFAQATQPTLP